MNWIWVFINIPAHYFFWLSLGQVLIGAFQGALAGACAFPLIMRLYPRSRFGQFCSAQSLLYALCNMVGGIAGGLYVDFVKWCCGGTDYAYRFLFAWTAVFSIVTAIIGVWAYRYWYRLGGDARYHPPAPWSATKVEEIEIVPVVGPQFRWLNIALNMFNATMALSAFGIPLLMVWMYYRHATLAFFWHAVMLLPLSLLAWFCWMLVEKSIRRDIEKVRRNEPLHNGIPHHGVLIVVAIKFLLAIGLWIAQIVIMVNLHQQQSAIVFGIANVIVNFALIGSVWLMCRVERGFSVTIDVRPARAS